MSDKMYASESKQFGQAMNSIAYAETMVAAIRDYKKEYLDGQRQHEGQGPRINVEELSADPELQQLHADRLAKVKDEREKRAAMQMKGHGTLAEIVEADFLEVVLRTDLVVAHFYAREFERCKIMDRHLEVLAKKYFDTRFIKISAQDAPFFAVKLKIKVLPCVVCFVNGVSVHSVVGFEPLGATDDFNTAVLEDMLLLAGAVKAAPPPEPETTDHAFDAPNKKLRHGIHYTKTASDEDSDFD